MSAYDLTDQLMKSDYFLDVNPRNLRRLINIIALTGRLLRAYHIEFNWRILASWIYLNEQWPYRCSWIIMHYEEHEQEFSEDATINEVYEQVKHQIPISNEPLLELDRNARKFEQFIQNCKPNLTVAILKKLLPCTCNLDPYLIKLIKDSIDAYNEKVELLTHLNGISSTQNTFNPALNNLTFNSGFNSNLLSSTNLSRQPILLNTNPSFDINASNSKVLLPKTSDEVNRLVMRRTNLKNMDSNTSDFFMNTTTTRINMSKPLIEMSVQDVCEEIDNTIDYMNDEFKQIYKSFLRENNISGKVLACCELDELKAELKMTFGDWQLFKNWILNQRAAQVSVDYIPSKKDSVDTKDNFYKLKQQAQEKANVYQEPEKPVEKNKLPEEQQQPKASMPNRKVEFFITPVVEYVNHESKHEPPKSILVKQASEQANSLSQTMSSSSSLQQDSSSAMLLNTSRNEKINEDGYYANLTPIQKSKIFKNYFFIQFYKF